MDNFKISHGIIASARKPMLYENKKDTELSPEISGIIKDFKSCNSMYDAFDVIDAHSKGDTLYTDTYLPNVVKYDDYYVILGKQFAQAPLCENLKSVQDLNLSCAPKLVAYIPLANDNDSVMITKIDGTKDSQLKKFNTVSKDVSANAKMKLINDFNIMAQNGFYNPAITETTRNWQVTPDLDTIYIDNWGKLLHIDSDDKKNQLRTELSSMCNLIY